MLTPLPLPAHILLDEVAGALRSVPAEVQAHLAPLPPEGLAWDPGGGRWSVARCLDHLTVTGCAYRARIEPALGDAERAP